MFKELGDRRNVGTALYHLGGIYYLSENYEKSFYYCEKSLKIYKEDEDLKGMLLPILLLGQIYLEEKKANDVALEFFKDSLEISLRLGYLKGIGEASGRIGLVYAIKEKYNIALKYLIISSKILDSLKSPSIKTPNRTIDEIKEKIDIKTFNKYYNEIIYEIEKKDIYQILSEILSPNK